MVQAEEMYGHVYCKNTKKPQKIALTFDDGPHPRYTEQILKILQDYQITATFFIVGVNAENYPNELKKIVEAGCEIGNHTGTHVQMNHLSEEEMEREIRRCEETVFNVTGIRPKLFRPPGGIMPNSMAKIAMKLNYNVILWNIDTLDWALNSPENIQKNVLSNLKGGDIILMHDYVSGGNTTCEALKRIIPAILAQNYEFVTVSELISSES